MNKLTFHSVELDRWIKALRWEWEKLTRRVDLFRPRNESEYLSTLRFLVAASGDERDVHLIEVARGIGKFHSNEADWLIRQAGSRIRSRESRDAEHRPYVEYPDPLGFVTDQTALLIEQLNSMNPDASDLWFLAHSSAAETIERRVQLVQPRTEAELRRALYWAAARGEKADAQLLDALPQLLNAFRFGGLGVMDLRERAKKSINNRLEARRLMDELLKSASEPKVTVATEAFRLGMRSRGTGAPRGDVIRPADVRVSLDDSERLQAARVLRSPNPELRNQFALALGELGGEQEAQTLARSLREDLESKEGEQFARYCIAALKNIGGQTAANALCYAVENGPEGIQLSALNAIEELATGGSEVYGEGTPRFNPPLGRYAKGEPPVPGTEHITETLVKMMNTAESKAVRERSKELLFHALV